jgi:hypothetical protein
MQSVVVCCRQRLELWKYSRMKLQELAKELLENEISYFFQALFFLVKKQDEDKMLKSVSLFSHSFGCEGNLMHV